MEKVTKNSPARSIRKRIKRMLGLGQTPADRVKLLENKVESQAKKQAVQREEIQKLREQIRRLSEKAQSHNGGIASAAPSLEFERELESLKVLCGHLAAQRVKGLAPETPLEEAEFKVFSQWGEDGILQFLLSHVPVSRKVFVEFGVESYAEANTRFLLQHDGWDGVIFDGSDEYMRKVRESDLYWRHTLSATSAWVAAENINDLLTEAGATGDVGVLSIDIDGMDYWVWKAISVARARIVVVEFNSLFGPSARVTPPYRTDFDRSKAHFSHLFYGVSLAGAESLAREKGYSLIGVNSAANNAFFVREDLAGPFPERTAADLWRPCRFRESRSPEGELVFPSFDQARDTIANCMVTDLATGRNVPLEEAVGWDAGDTRSNSR